MSNSTFFYPGSISLNSNKIPQILLKFNQNPIKNPFPIPQNRLRLTLEFQSLEIWESHSDPLQIPFKSQWKKHHRPQKTLPPSLAPCWARPHSAPRCHRRRSTPAALSRWGLDPATATAWRKLIRSELGWWFQYMVSIWIIYGKSMDNLWILMLQQFSLRKTITSPTGQS